jgi:hypothetical protein
MAAREYIEKDFCPRYIRSELKKGRTVLIETMGRLEELTKISKRKVSEEIRPNAGFIELVFSKGGDCFAIDSDRASRAIMLIAK